MKIEDLKNTLVKDDNHGRLGLVIEGENDCCGLLFSQPDALRAAALFRASFEMQQTLIQIQEMASRILTTKNSTAWAEVLRLTSDAINMSNNTNETL